MVAFFMRCDYLTSCMFIILSLLYLSCDRISMHSTRMYIYALTTHSFSKQNGLCLTKKHTHIFM